MTISRLRMPTLDRMSTCCSLASSTEFLSWKHQLPRLPSSSAVDDGLGRHLPTSTMLDWKSRQLVAWTQTSACCSPVPSSCFACCSARHLRVTWFFAILKVLKFTLILPPKSK